MSPDGVRSSEGGLIQTTVGPALLEISTTAPLTQIHRREYGHKRANACTTHTPAATNTCT